MGAHKVSAQDAGDLGRAQSRSTRVALCPRAGLGQRPHLGQNKLHVECAAGPLRHAIDESDSSQAAPEGRDLQGLIGQQTPQLPPEPRGLSSVATGGALAPWTAASRQEVTQDSPSSAAAGMRRAVAGPWPNEL